MFKVLKKSFLLNNKRIILCLILFFFKTFLYAQLNVNSTVTAFDIAQTLMGNSVKIDSAYINCETGAYGIFKAQNITNLPFQEGVLLTTGNAQAVARPADNNINPGLLDFNLSSSGNSFIQTMMNQNTEDACELKVFVKPMGNNLRVDYLFASEEYPEQVNKYYFDAFVFIVNGPRPNGGNYNDTNIAKLTTGQPVTVATINNGPNNAGPCANCQFYKNNLSNTKMGYDGVTTPLVATLPVTPCQNYELTLIIADVKDGKYDSGVFFKKGAINSVGQASISVSRSQICKGQTTSVTAQSNTIQNFSWSTGETTSQITVQPLQSTNYTCFYSYCGVDGYQVTTVTVDTIHPTTDYSYSSTILCKGDSIAIPQLTNGTGIFYSTNFQLQVNTSGVINLTQTPEGVYPLTLSVTQGYCPGTVTKTVTVKNNPELTVSGGENYCSNSKPNPIVLSALGALPFSIGFIKDSFIKDTTVNNGIVLLNLGKGSYSQFKVKDGNGCTTKSQQNIVQQELDAPKSEFIINQKDSCQNRGISIQNLSSINRSIITLYQWFINDSLLSTQSDFNLSQMQAGNFKIQLVSFANNGCTDTLTKQGYTKPSPVALFEHTNPCFGDTVKLFNLSTSPSALIKIENWQLNNQPFALTYFTAYDSVNNIKLKITNNFGCSDSLTKQIITLPNPKPHFTFANVCEGDTFYFKNQSTSLSGNTLAYSWDVGNKGSYDYVSKDLQFIKNQPGKIWIKLLCADNMGCKANALQLAEVYPNPQINYSVTETSGCSPFTLKVENKSTISNGFTLAKHHWKVNETEFSSQNLQQKLIKPGDYKFSLEITSNKGCVSSIKSDSIIHVFAATPPKFDIFPSDISTINNQFQIDFSHKKHNHWVEFNKQLYSSFDGLVNLNAHDSGWQTLTLIEQNTWGCYDTSKTEIYIKSDFSAYLPNTFTPNADGLNEQLCLMHYGISNQNFLFRIMNRNNEEVFATTDINECWDGRDKQGNKLMQGVYIYEINLRTEQMIEKNLKGTVLLLR